MNPQKTNVIINNEEEMDDVSESDLWENLSISEKEIFLKTAQTYISQALVEPWWMQEEEFTVDQGIPLKQIIQKQPHPNLILHLYDLLLTYCYHYRHFNADLNQAADSIKTFSMVLRREKQTILFESAKEALETMRTIHRDEMKMPLQVYLYLMTDVCILLESDASIQRAIQELSNVSKEKVLQFYLSLIQDEEFMEREIIGRKCKRERLRSRLLEYREWAEQEFL
jgi:hypothetical protein